MKKWYEVYHQLSVALHKYFLLHDDATGSILYDKAFIRLRRIRYFNWLGNNEYRSLDPIQIFSSFSRPSQSSVFRTKIISIWFEILDQPFYEDEIDFVGCPTPISIKITSSRDKQSQLEIWQLFRAVIEKKEGISEQTFLAIKKWYGIDVPFQRTFYYNKYTQLSTTSHITVVDKEHLQRRKSGCKSSRLSDKSTGCIYDDHFVEVNGNPSGEFNV